jgi:hypothetical protein
MISPATTSTMMMGLFCHISVTKLEKLESNHPHFTPIRPEIKVRANAGFPG